ncbi:MAG: Hsp20/alpha crystallin family protein [Thaumarchaeota archaeon]|nr:Hsp20/alpha crystallin family protein [Nitrososphaerota archaeon]
MSDFGSFIEKQMNSFFEDTVFNDFTHRELVPLSHFNEKHSSWILEIDLPLVDKKNIEIILSTDHLSINAKLTKTFCISKGNVVTEFNCLRKMIKIPNGIDTKQISAIFKNGVLKITMPKLVQGRKIPIK